MNLKNNKVRKALNSRSALKVITGINNTNIGDIIKIVQAASLSQATYVDIVANPRLVHRIKKSFNLPICISSINPLDIYNCLIAGADLVEIGNYDFFYQKGIYLTAEQILSLVLEVKLFSGDIDICVTIPYHISLTSQLNLAKRLEVIGVNIIQTEGIANLCESKYLNPSLDISNLNNTFLPSLLSTYMISKIVKIPIIAASGCQNLVSSLAGTSGASGIGIGSSLKKCKTIREVVNYIDQSHSSLVLCNSLEDDLDKLVNMNELIKF